MFSSDIGESFWGTLGAILITALLWMIKTAYQRHKDESLSLAKMERALILNIRYQTDNQEMIEQWIQSLVACRPFRFHIQSTILLDEETFKISDVKLITSILTINYKLQRMHSDLLNVYQHYWEILDKLFNSDKEIPKDNIDKLHESIKKNLELMVTNYPLVEEEIFRVIAKIRDRARVRKHSLFGYLELLNKDVWPKITEESYKDQRRILEENRERIKHQTPENE